MPQKISLRRCQEHEDCRLQKADDGPWEHTPAGGTLIDRLEGRYNDLEAKREITESLAKVQYLMSILEAERAEANTWLASVQAETAGLPRVMDLWAKGDQAGVRVHKQLEMAQRALERLERASQRVDLEAARRAATLQKVDEAEVRIRDAEAKTEERLRLAGEKLEQAESLLSRLRAREADLNRVDVVYDAVDQLSGELKVGLAAAHAADKETRRQIKHEREERLAATAKGIRSLQSHIEVSHA